MVVILLKAGITALRIGAKSAPLKAGTAVVLKNPTVARYTLKLFGKKAAKRIGKGIVTEGRNQVVTAVVTRIFDHRGIRDTAGSVPILDAVPSILPSTKTATKAWEDAVRDQKNIKGIVVITRSKRFVQRIARGGLTPLLPVVGAAVRRNILVGLGVPRWVIVVHDVVR